MQIARCFRVALVAVISLVLLVVVGTFTLFYRPVLMSSYSPGSSVYPPSSNQLSADELGLVENCFKMHGVKEAQRLNCFVDIDDPFIYIAIRVDASPSVMNDITSAGWLPSMAVSRDRLRTFDLTTIDGSCSWWDVSPIRGGDQITGMQLGGFYDSRVIALQRRRDDDTMSLYYVRQSTVGEIDPRFIAAVWKLAPKPQEGPIPGQGERFEAFWQRASR